MTLTLLDVRKQKYNRKELLDEEAEVVENIILSMAVGIGCMDPVCYERKNGTYRDPE